MSEKQSCKTCKRTDCRHEAIRPVDSKTCNFYLKPEPQADKRIEEVLELNDGKYTILLKDGVPIECLRNGEKWRSLIGDNLILALIDEIKNAEKLHSLFLQLRL